MRTYAIVSSYCVIRDRDDERLERLKFHIEHGDYFPFLATVIGILGEAAAKCTSPVESAFAEDMRKDLIYLHERYDLVEKKERLAYTKEKVVRFGHEHPRNDQGGHSGSA